MAGSPLGRQAQETVARDGCQALQHPTLSSMLFNIYLSCRKKSSRGLTKCASCLSALTQATKWTNKLKIHDKITFKNLCYQTSPPTHAKTDIMEALKLKHIQRHENDENIGEEGGVSEGMPNETNIFKDCPPF